VFAAILDTCTLWPSRQRDVLLSLAVEGMYRPLWSSVILAELEYEEAHKLRRRGVTSRVAAERAAHLIQQMRTAFDDACVTGWEGLEGTFGLPDPDDEHVLAAAVIGGAGAIVTDNIKDFPPAVIPSHIHVLSPAEFAGDTVSVSPIEALSIIERVASSLSRPPMTTDELLDLLPHRYGWHRAVALMREVR
jgi:predicted nucleic acid-binding protein